MRNSSTHSPFGKMLARMTTHQNSSNKANLDFGKSSAALSKGAMRSTKNADGFKNFIVGKSLVDGDDVVV